MKKARAKRAKLFFKLFFDYIKEKDSHMIG